MYDLDGPFVNSKVEVIFQPDGKRGKVVYGTIP